MPLHVLQGESLGLLNEGYLGRCLDKTLLEVMNDIDDRGSDGLKRTITLKIIFKPLGEGQVSINTEVTSKVPGYKPPTTIGRLDQNAGGIMFREDSPKDPDQRTLNDELADK